MSIAEKCLYDKGTKEQSWYKRRSHPEHLTHGSYQMPKAERIRMYERGRNDAYRLLIYEIMGGVL